MYDDASYYTFIPSAATQEERQSTPQHRRRQSLLKQPNVSHELLFALPLSDISYRKMHRLTIAP